MNDNRHTVALIAPFPPPTGGMALQAEKLYKKILSSGIGVLCIKSNASFPGILSWLEELKGVRTAMRFILFSKSLLKIREAAVVQIFGASHVYFFLVVLPSIVVACMMKKKIILNYRGGEAERFLKKWGLLAVPVLKKADIIAVPSEFLKEIFLKATGKDAVILPNIIDIDIFKFRERSSLKPKIIVSRQLEARYNVACALKAFKIIKKEYPEAELYIAGSGPEEDNLKKILERMSLSDVNFLGLLSHEQLSHVYNECDIMINSSSIDNFPGSILEAFACGIPVVSTRVGGIPYMIEDGVTGLLVEPNDHEGIAAAVLKLLGDSSLVKSLSLKGRKMAKDHCWEKVRKVLFDLYEFDHER
jgi:glycosyltransferase involved in cell wall biosynthesis